MVNLCDNKTIFSVAAVIVTYNRLKKLKTALNCYEEQILLPEYLIVVNNCSNDGTSEYLEEWKMVNSSIKKIVINTNENLGGSGGFYEGQKAAIELDVDWIYLADDDAYPKKDYFQKIENYIKLANVKNLSAVCGKVVEKNNDSGHCAYLNNWSTNIYIGVPAVDYNSEKLEVDATSYIGVFINKDILKKAGLVNKNFFIWQDDLEHSCRLKKYGSIICFPKAEIIHDASSEHFQLSWKFYYLYRNRTYLILKHFKIQACILLPLLLIKSILCPLKGKSLTEVKMRLTAIKDGVCGKLGKHSVYQPGWKP